LYYLSLLLESSTCDIISISIYPIHELKIFCIYEQVIYWTDEPHCFDSHDIIEEELEDTKGVIGIRISKKNRQNIGQKKKDKMTNSDLQNIHIKLQIK